MFENGEIQSTLNWPNIVMYIYYMYTHIAIHKDITTHHTLCTHYSCAIMGCQITCKTRDALLNNSYWKKGEQLEMLSIRIHLEHLKLLQGLDYGFSFSTVLSTVDYKSFLILSRNLKRAFWKAKKSRTMCGLTWCTVRDSSFKTYQGSHYV